MTERTRGPGRPRNLTEEDVRRIAREEIRNEYRDVFAALAQTPPRLTYDYDHFPPRYVGQLGGKPNDA